MRLATYQPKILNEENYSTCTKLFRDYLGYVPIWCIPAETPEQFIFGTWYASANCPETVVSIDTNRYVPFDFVKWNQIRHKENLSPDDLKICFQNVNPKYAEYILPEELLSNEDDGVIDVITINELSEIAHHSIHNILDETDTDIGNQWFDVLVDYIDNITGNEEIPVYDIYSNQWIHDKTMQISAKLYKINMIGGYILYDIAFHDVLALPFIIAPILPAEDGPSSTESILTEADMNMSDFYDNAENATYERFDRICFLFEKLLESRSKYVCEHMMHVGRNSTCPCMSGKKYKKCHGGKISVRPDHI